MTTGPCAPCSGDGGLFGSWADDDLGLPCFDYAPGATRTRDTLVLPAEGPSAVWHQVANQAITATAHANGGVTLYSTRRGVIRLTASERGWGVPGLDPASLRARFGLGYGEWHASAPGVELTRRVWAPGNCTPYLLIEVSVVARDSTTYLECWPYAPYPVSGITLMSPLVPPPSGYPARLRAAWRIVYGTSAASRTLTVAARRLLAQRLAAHPRHDREHQVVVLDADRRVLPRRRPVWFDPWIGIPFVAHLHLPDDHQDAEMAPAGWGFRAPLPAGRSRLRFAIGLADDEDHLERLLREMRCDDSTAQAPLPRAILRLETIDRKWLSRETTWHAGYLVGCETPDDAFGHRYPAQGSAYGFVHGLQGAPRDYAISSVPLVFVDPDGARDALRVMMRLTRVDGTMAYAHTGHGRVTPGGVHTAPTDLPIWLLWALTEYVWARGDHAFLDEVVLFHPASSGEVSTVRERIMLAFHALRDRVGLGEHGMLRVGSGDWSDPISMMVRDRRAFHRHGESGFNTAFAAYALARAARLIEAHQPGVATEMRDFADGCRAAMLDSWNGRWFLRGWDGRGHPVGDRHLFLDGQVWCLIAGIGDEGQRCALVREIATRCDDPSPIGATILDRPHRVRAGMLAPGSDCNGGVWAAMNALLAWGYALHDPELARRSLAKQSLAAHAAAYPHVWYGIWSGPDSYNAHFGERPGETFVQPATPMTEFPVMNSNAHAGPLLAMLRVLGVETGPDGAFVADRGLSPRWRLETALGHFSGGTEPR